MSEHSDEGDTNELIIIDGSSSGEQLLPLDGIPEPQIGPQFRPFRVPEVVSSGDRLEAVSQDSLEILEPEVIPTPANSRELEIEDLRPESARSNRSNRVVYMPTQNIDSNRATPTQNLDDNEDLLENDSHLENEDITERIEPLISGSHPSWVNSVLDRVLPDLKTSLDAEYDKERRELEQEHKSRLQALHAQHHHAQFEMYEKLVKAQELIQKMEEEIECKNKTIHKLSLSILKEKEKPILATALYQWRMNLQERKVEQKSEQMMRELNKRALMRNIFNQWHNLIKQKWKAKVEKVCKERATEICIKLKDELTGEINRLEQEVKNRDSQLAEFESKQNNYEENLTKALMRGVCALNMEAMSVLHRPEDEEEHVPQPSGMIPPVRPQNSRKPDTADVNHLVAPHNSLAHIQNGYNTISNSYNNTPRAISAQPVPNVFLNTVSTLEDFSRPGQKKLQVRNSSEFNGSMAGSTEVLHAQSSKRSNRVVIERHDGSKTIRTKSPLKPRQDQPWRPVGRLSTNIEKSSQPRKKLSRTSSSVKYVD